MAKIATITNPLTGQPVQVDQLEHTAQQIDDAIARALPGGAIDIALAKKTEITLLWENASPTSSFSDQTISLDLSKYSYVLIEILKSIAGDLQTAIIVPVTNLYGRGVVVNQLVDGGKMSQRKFTASPSGVAITDGGFASYPYTDWTSYHSYAVPWRIHGLKNIT